MHGAACPKPLALSPDQPILSFSMLHAACMVAVNISVIESGDKAKYRQFQTVHAMHAPIVEV